jgi:predicted DNA-binding protein
MIKPKINKLISISPETNKDLLKLSQKEKKPVTELIREAINLLIKQK